MNTTENQMAIIERPSDKKWPYVLGGFIAGAASIIGLACVFGDDTDDTYCESSPCDDEDVLLSDEDVLFSTKETEEDAEKELNSLSPQTDDTTEK